MTKQEALALSGRSESWLRRHACAWCDRPLWMALRSGCGTMYEPKCDPAKKDYRLAPLPSAGETTEPR